MREFEKRAMIDKEDKYTFRQSSQISSQTGLIGYLRADMDKDGKGFFSSWNDYRADLKTDEFKSEFDEVINSLREEGDILHSRQALASYCRSTPQARMNTEQEYYGVRVDTDKYAYFMRLNPNKGEYNLYCYCYRRDWLDRHIKEAESGIRFITPHYKEIFRIPDGDRVRIMLRNGEHRDRTARYIDAYHIELNSENGSNLYHICEFAEHIENVDAKVIPLRSSLPERCFVYVESADEIGIVTKGEKGYMPLGQKPEGLSKREGVVLLNDTQGVTKAQAEAMKAGSLFGWDIPAADPASYDADGLPNAQRLMDDFDSRRSAFTPTDEQTVADADDDIEM